MSCVQYNDVSQLSEWLALQNDERDSSPENPKTPKNELVKKWNEMISSLKFSI